jgi:transcriptional regulator with XRE-family HTH domain
MRATEAPTRTGRARSRPACRQDHRALDCRQAITLFDDTRQQVVQSAGMAEPGESVGQRLKRLRRERGLTQKDVAGPGVHPAYVSRIESGDRKPSLDALRVLAAKLDVSLEYLETGEEVPPAAERELQLADAELELRLGRDLDGAEARLRRLVIEGSRDPITARARAALGTLAARRGNHSEAVSQLEAATRSGIRPRDRSEVYETLATSYVAVGAPKKAIALLERCIQATAEHAALQIRYRSFLGMTLSSIGDVERAKAVLVDAVERAEGYALPSARVVLYWTLARVAWMERSTVQALRYMGRAISLLETTEDTLQLARANLTCGQFCNLDSDWAEARRYLDRAERLLEQAGDADDLGLLRAEQAKSLAKLGFVAQALEYAIEADGLLKDDARFKEAGWHALGVAQAAAGDIDAADEHFRRAVDELVERRQWREASAAARDWASALRAARRNDEAFEAYNRASELAIRDLGTRRVS